MQFVQEFDGLDVGPLRQYLSNCPVSFEQSKVYSTAKEEKFVDEHMRKSQFRDISDSAIFDLVAAAIKVVEAQMDEAVALSLVRNNITHIKYGPGGFFDKHRDYVTVTSNVVEEYTLIINVNDPEVLPACEGGETVIYPNPSLRMECKSSVTPGSCLLFRKDLEHEGLPLTSGTKEIVTANLWATRNACSQVLLVTFPSEKTTHPTAACPLQALAMTPSYAIPVDALEHCATLRDYVQFHNTTAESTGEDTHSVVEYACTNVTFEEFRTLFRILSRAYVTAEEVEKRRMILDFYGVRGDDILINISEKPPPESGLNVPPAVICDGNIIICSSVDHSAVIASYAKALEADYIPFRLYFAEGTIEYGGEMTGTPPATLAMCPVWADFGDYHNILGARGVISKGRQDIFAIDQHNIATLLDRELPTLAPGESPSFRKDDRLNEELGEWDLWGSNKIASFGLEYAVPSLGCGKILELLNIGPYELPVPGEMIFLPGGDSCPTEAKTAFYHLDDTGKVCFSATEAQTAAAFIVQQDVLGRVREQIRALPFVVPQEQRSTEAFFCNENVYGRLNFIEICGGVLVSQKE